MNHITYFYHACVFTVSILLVSHLCADNQPSFKNMSPDQVMNIAPASKVPLPPALAELHDTFRNDPKYYGFVLKGNPDPVLVQEFQERLDRAAYALVKMGLKMPLTRIEQESCYTFGDYLDDPLCHDFLYRISQTADELKFEKMSYSLAVLEDRFLFTHVYHHKAKERYDRNALDPETKKRTLDMIWQHRYFFATVPHDPILDRLLDHLPLRTEISQKLQEMLMDRLFEVRLRLQDWNLLHYARDGAVETALYHLNDTRRFDPNPLEVVGFLTSYCSDQGNPQVYDALFTAQHLSRCLKHDLTLLEGIDIPRQIGLKENMLLRTMYEKLLLLEYVSQEQRDVVRLCLRFIMRACLRKEDKPQYYCIAQRVFDEIQCDDVPEIFLRNQSLLQALCDGHDDHVEAITQIILDLRNGSIHEHEAIALCAAIGA